MIGKKYKAAVKNNYEPRKIARILKQHPAPAFFTKNFADHNIIVDEAPDSATAKEAMFHKMIWYQEHVGPVEPGIMVELSDLPQKYRDRQMQFMAAQMNAVAQAQRQQGVPARPQILQRS